MLESDGGGNFHGLKRRPGCVGNHRRSHRGRHADLSLAPHFRTGDGRVVLHRKPISPAAMSPLRMAVRDSFISFITRTIAGIVPAEPRVGAVTARRPAALPSEKARA